MTKLHRPRSKPPPDRAIPIRRRFSDLERMAAAPGKHQELLAAAWLQARELISGDRDTIVLHGDIHHWNVLHDPERGWAAIDPKGVLGPRGYDYANILCNPFGADFVHAPGRLRDQAELIAATAELALDEVLAWTFAHASLSAAWSILEGESPQHAIKVAITARGMLRG